MVYMHYIYIYIYIIYIYILRQSKHEQKICCDYEWSKSHSGSVEIKIWREGLQSVCDKILEDVLYV